MKKITVLLMLLTAQFTHAADYKASLAQMPVYAESAQKGVLVDLVKAMQKQSRKTIEHSVVPFARSLNNATTGAVHFHFPLIEPLDTTALKFRLSKTTLFHVNFVLYTNKKKPLDVKSLEGKVIETDFAHIPYFPFKVLPSGGLEQSLKKVEDGEIDGFIFADNACDPIIKAKGFKKIQRQLYKRFNVKGVLPKDNSDATDAFISDTISALAASGELSRILGIVDQPYSDWQP